MDRGNPSPRPEIEKRRWVPGEGGTGECPQRGAQQAKARAQGVVSRHTEAPEHANICSNTFARSLLRAGRGGPRAGRGLCWSGETVAPSWLGQQHLRPRGIPLELLAQPVNIDAQVFGLTAILRSPDPL